MAIPKRKRKSAPVGVIAKVLRILELLDSCPDGLQLKDVAEKTGINKSTALRFLSHLEAEDYLLRDAGGAYMLGLRLMRLGSSKSYEKMLIKMSRPAMENLRKITSETVNLAVLHGVNILHLDALDSPHQFSIVSQVGRTGEIYSTALGKAIVAFMEDGPRKDEIFNSIQFVAKTPRTIMSIGRLKEDLAHTKRQGFSHDDEEAFAGARCIGAPVFGPDGNVIAAVSISGPISRIPKQRLQHYGGLVRQAAKEIAASIGVLSSNGNSDQVADGPRVNGRKFSQSEPLPQSSSQRHRANKLNRVDHTYLSPGLKATVQTGRKVRAAATLKGNSSPIYQGRHKAIIGQKTWDKTAD
jgi:IclR family KDG regulon transcriptional repressor